MDIKEHLDNLDETYEDLENEIKVMHTEGHFADDIVLREVVNIKLAIAKARKNILGKVNFKENRL
ncbi:MAG: hypothetical protein PHG53_09595 [Phycisphaerae bacterium]|nr:hypothetical protein [Phycisphaerae bacterium]